MEIYEGSIKDYLKFELKLKLDIQRKRWRHLKAKKIAFTVKGDEKILLGIYKK